MLDDYIRTPEVFWVVSEKTGVPEGYRNPLPPGGKIGPTWAIGKRGGSPQGAAVPPPYWESKLD